MPHKSDIDTETGLPRKLGWRVAIWAIVALETVAIAYLGQMQGRLDGIATKQDVQAAKQTEALERIARIEGKLSIVATAGAPAVASKLGPPPPIP